PGMEDLVADGIGKVEDVPEAEKIEPGMSAPAHALRNLVIAERHRIAGAQGRLIKGQISLMDLAADRSARGEGNRGLLAAAARRRTWAAARRCSTETGGSGRWSATRRAARSSMTSSAGCARRGCRGPRCSPATDGLPLSGLESRHGRVV